MRFGFLNNFAAQLAAPVADDATEIELSTGAEAIATALEDADAVALTLFATDSQGNETKREVVYATAVTESVLTVEREQEGSTAQVFSPGENVEGRLTAGSLHGLSLGVASSLQKDENGNIFSPYAAGHDYNPEASSDGIAIGTDSYITGDNGVALGKQAFAAESSIAMGNSARGQGMQTIALGDYSSCYDDYTVNIGGGSVNGVGSIAVGNNAGVSSAESISIGQWTSVWGAGAVSVGTNSGVQADGGISIGYRAKCNVPGGMSTTGISYLPSYFESPYDGVPAAAMSTAAQIVIASNSLDLTDGSDEAIFELPDGIWFFVDAFELVVISSTGASGSPEIQIGADASTPANYLAPTIVSKTAVGGRDTHAPLVADGITSLRVSVVTAGAGTAYTIKVIARGYVMEV